jgi:hypothetical protein
MSKRNDPDYRPTCKRCNGTGRTGYTFHGGGCFGCADRGRKHSLNDRIAIAHKELAAIVHAGKVAAGRLERALDRQPRLVAIRKEQLEALRADYRAKLAQVRKLEARRDAWLAKKGAA